MIMKLEQIIKAARTQAAKDLMVNADVLESDDITRDAVLIADTCEMIDDGLLQTLSQCVDFTNNNSTNLDPTFLENMSKLQQMF